MSEDKQFTIIHFEDHGQDFLRWIVNPEGEVVISEPFQQWIWRGNIVNLETLCEGKTLSYTSTRGGERHNIRYPVEKIEKSGPVPVRHGYAEHLRRYQIRAYLPAKSHTGPNSQPVSGGRPGAKSWQVIYTGDHFGTYMMKLDALLDTGYYVEEEEVESDGQ